MDRLWRSNSSVSSWTGCPPDIVNEEDHTIDDNELIPDFRHWTIPKVDTKIIYYYNCNIAFLAGSTLFLYYFQHNITVLPPLWYQSHSFLANDSVVVFSVFLSVSTRNFDSPLLCSLFTIVGATHVGK